MIYTPKSLAEKLGVTLQFAQKLCASGRIKAVNLSEGRKRPTYRVTEESLQDFLNPHLTTATKKTQRRSRIDRDVRQVY